MSDYARLTNYITAQQTDQVINLPTNRLTNQPTNHPIPWDFFLRS